MHRFFANIISAFVRDKHKRHELRDRLTTKSRVRIIIEEFAAMRSLIKAQALHPDTFGPYRGAHTGREAVIVATGPTLADYEPIEGAIHIGVNAAFKWPKAKLDYLFLQDAVYAGMDRNNRPCGFSIADVNNYNAEGCVKFYGIAQPLLMEKVPTIRIPFADLLASNAKPYILEDPERHSVAYDLSREAMGSYSSVSFSALQFALYTNVKRIYLVGADCGGAYFDKSAPKKMTFGTAANMIRDWEFFKEYISAWYPETEIVSINPRGLRGLFRDIDAVPPPENLGR